jgi:cell fate regulator YaaT (PSP1 superfamily)
VTAPAVAHLIEVAFKGNRKEFFLWEGENPPVAGVPVVVEADRGEDLGRVHAVGDLAAQRCGGCSHGCGSTPPERKALRTATSEEVDRLERLRGEDDAARRKAIEKVRTHKLSMKVSDAEWQWDRRKLTFYFTAESRVDFRDLVRDLAASFRTRIELKQIGVRDEAKRLDGVGRCGRQYCSASWLPELRPVNLQVAKDQRLSLNPSQISGACGRLMCCLRYEHEFYVQARKRFPKEGKVLVTPVGEEKVIFNDIFGERVTLINVEGDTRIVPLAELRKEMQPAAATRAEAAEDGPPRFSARPERGRHAAEARAEMPLDAGPTDHTPPPPSPDSATDDRQEDGRSRRPRRRGRRGGRRGRTAGDKPGDPSTEN